MTDPDSEDGDGRGSRTRRTAALVAQVDALWAEGPPERGVVARIEANGIAYFEVRALALRCLGCGLVVPQSRTRVSREARAIWLVHHAACGGAKPAP